MKVHLNFKRITAHEGPLERNAPAYQGSKYNVMVEWENGEVTTEPLSIMATDAPVVCDRYARDNGLLNTDGWKHLKKIARKEKILNRHINQAKISSYRYSPKYKYGYQVPTNYLQAIQLDQKFGNTKWRDATKLELSQLAEYNVFKDLGHKDGINKFQKQLQGYKKIRVHLIFDVKHDGRHKARLVADGNLMDAPLTSVYSGVVSLRGIRLITFIAELNGMETWATDVGNAYLEAQTNEKVYIVAGPEFQELENHIFIIHKALYGLKSSGLCWHHRLADCLREMEFFPCKAEPDIWMGANGDVYEYIAVYVDDLAIVAKDPQGIADHLSNQYNFKLKETGPISYHLGMDFFRDNDNTLCYAPNKYIKRMTDSYIQLFGTKPVQNVYAPLESGDHPELDQSELLGTEDIQKYQSLIGSLQWAISIGRFDITTAVMTLSSFRAAPRKGHLDRAKRVYGCITKMKDAVIRIRTGEPDYSDLPELHFE